MRALLVACVVMGVLIVAGVAVLVAAIVGRSPPQAGVETAQVVLDEPAGTRIAGASGTADALLLVLTGGGPDRVLAVDRRSGRVEARVRLAR